MSKVIAAFLAMAPWVVYTFGAVDKRSWGPALGGLAGTCAVFYFIWFKLEEVD